MANALTPSSPLKDKINIKPVGTRTQEATAEDFIELGAILDDHALKIDALVNSASSNPYYGRYTSLALLQAAHTTVDANAWAVIDSAPGVTPQIAFWNGTDWALSLYEDNTIEVATYNDLPLTGVTGKWYVTQNTNYLYRWYNSQYNLVGVPANLEVLLSGFYVETTGKTNLSVWQDGDKFRGWYGDRYLVGKVIDATSLNMPTDVDDNTKVSLSVNN